MSLLNYDQNYPRRSTSTLVQLKGNVSADRSHDGHMLGAILTSPRGHVMCYLQTCAVDILWWLYHLGVIWNELTMMNRFQYSLYNFVWKVIIALITLLIDPENGKQIKPSTILMMVKLIVDTIYNEWFISEN